MNAPTRRPIAALRRAACGSLTAALLLGGGWGLASPAAATKPLHPHDDPLEVTPYALGGPWLSGLPPLHRHRPGYGHGHRTGHRHGHWRSGPPESWSSPVTSSRVSAEYGIRGDWAAGHHTGVDFAVPVGTPVHSVGSGEVVFAGWSGAYGKAVTVRMDDGTYTLFAHLSKIRVDEGDRVKAGTLLGESGNTGRSTGPHLHFEVREGRDYGTDVNPLAYLEERGVEVV